MLYLNFTNFWNLLQAYNLLDSSKMISRKEASMQLEFLWNYDFLWNHVVIQQGVFNRLKVAYYITSSMNNSENLWDIWFYQFAILEKMQKLICKLPKCFANSELWTANLNP